MYNYIKKFVLLLLFFLFLPNILQVITQQYKSLIDPQARIAIIPITNIIQSSNEYTQMLYQYFADEHIKGILLLIDSPGSAAGSGNTLYDEIKILKKNFPKPIITLVENMCTSGAYWIACATDHIVVPGSSIIGNIGTQLNTPHIHKLLEKYDIEYTTIASGKYKTVGNPFIPLTNEQKEHIQNVQDDIYKQFVEVVAKERKLSLLDIDTWADGKIFTGKQALQIGLVDSMGSLQQAATILKEKAFIEGPIKWVRAEKTFGLLSSILQNKYIHTATQTLQLLSSFCCFNE